MDYMILRGLRSCGREALARSIASKLFEGTLRLFRSTGTIWENYSPEDSGRPAKGEPTSAAGRRSRRLPSAGSFSIAEQPAAFSRFLFSGRGMHREINVRKKI